LYGWSSAHADHDPGLWIQAGLRTREKPAGFDNGPRLLVAGNPVIDGGDQIIIEAC
jgi:hypothetical protein